MRLKDRRLALWLVATALFLIIVVKQSWSENAELSTSSVVSFLVVGISLGSIYALAASGIVVTYTTSGIFNFAQGAIGMFLAFVYWQLRVHQNLSTPVALVLTVLVIAPLLGAGIERLLMRHIADQTLVVQLVVTLGLMFGFMGLANTIWDPSKSRDSEMTSKVTPFFGTEFVEIADTRIPYYRLITIGTAILVAILLRLLLYRTRIGVAMRAVVDNRNLAALNGARPAQASMLAWALGSSLAAISGIFLVQELGLQVDALTLLIINAFAAAIVGRLRSLPMTYVGGSALGLAISFTQTFLDLRGRFTTAQFAIPSIFLFIVLLGAAPGTPDRAAQAAAVVEDPPAAQLEGVGDGPRHGRAVRRDGVHHGRYGSGQPEPPHAGDGDRGDHAVAGAAHRLGGTSVIGADHVRGRRRVRHVQVHRPAPSCPCSDGTSTCTQETRPGCCSPPPWPFRSAC